MEKAMERLQAFFVSLHPLNDLLALFACFTLLFFFHIIATLALGDAC